MVCKSFRYLKSRYDTVPYANNFWGIGDSRKHKPYPYNLLYRWGFFYNFRYLQFLLNLKKQVLPRSGNQFQLFHFAKHRCFSLDSMTCFFFQGRPSWGKWNFYLEKTTGRRGFLFRKKNWGGFRETELDIVLLLFFSSPNFRHRAPGAGFIIPPMCWIETKTSGDFRVPNFGAAAGTP